MKQPTIYEALKATLRREPTSAEINAKCRAIIASVHAEDKKSKLEAMPISDRLSAIGISHRPGTFNSKRECFRTDTGEIIGQMSAAEACEYLETQNG